MKLTSAQRREKEIADLDDAISRLELGKCIRYTPEYITDRIAWLWKWRRIDKETMDKFTERIIAYFRSQLGR